MGDGKRLPELTGSSDMTVRAPAFVLRAPRFFALEPRPCAVLVCGGPNVRPDSWAAAWGLGALHPMVSLSAELLWKVHARQAGIQPVKGIERKAIVS